MKNVNEVIKKNVVKVDKLMKTLLTPEINVLDKSVEAIVRKYFKSINGSNIDKIHQGIVKQLNIKTIEDSKYFDKSNLIRFYNKIKEEVKQKENLKNESKGE